MTGLVILVVPSVIVVFATTVCVVTGVVMIVLETVGGSVGMLKEPVEAAEETVDTIGVPLEGTA